VYLLGYLLALVIGLTLGMLGGGGSILTVPVFVYVLGYDPKLAIAMSLPVVGATSLIGAIGHWRAGNVRVRVTFVFGGLAMAAAFVAARLSIHLTGRVQLFILGITMLTASMLMLRASLKSSAPPPPPDGSVMPVALPLAGLAVGTLTGIVGIGGGFLIVPALVVFAHMPMRQAVGTSLTVIAMNAAAGFAGQHGVGAIPFDFVVVFSAVAMAGIVVGTWAVAYVHQRTLKRAFAVLLIVIAALMIWQNWTLW
jgi:uncharacterized protein